MVQARRLPDLRERVQYRRVRIRRQPGIAVRIDGQRQLGVRDRRVRARAVVREAGTLVEPREPIDDVGRGVGAHAAGTAVRGHREHVGRAAERRDGGPAGVAREAHVLDLGGGVAPVEHVEVVDGRETRAPRVRLYPADAGPFGLDYCFFFSSVDVPSKFRMSFFFLFVCCLGVPTNHR